MPPHIQRRRAHALTRWVRGVDYSGEAKPLKGLRILVVEDDSGNREVLTELLHLYGADSESCPNADEALQRIADAPAAQCPDLLVCDLCMPEVSGHELVRQIRELPAERGGDLPALAISGHEEELAQACASGFQRALAKPLDWTELLRAIEGLARPRAPVEH